MQTRFLSDCVYTHTRFSYWSCISSPNEPAPASCSMRTKKFSSGGWRGRAVKPTIHLHLMLKLRMSGDVPTLHHATSCPVQDNLTLMATGIVIGIRVRWPGISVSIPVKGKKYFCSPRYTAPLWSRHNPYTTGVGVSLLEVQAADCRR